MHEQSDRKFDWVAAMAFGLGTAVVVPSLAALAIAVVAAVVTAFS